MVFLKPKDAVSGLTHFAAIPLAITGLVLLICKSCGPAQPWHITTFSIFGAGMILLYVASTLYHWLYLSEKGTRRLKKFDHIMIFIFIAASYTPVCLISLRGGWGWSIFGCVWGVAVIGVCMKLFCGNVHRWFSTSIYIFMGWLVLVGICPLMHVLNTTAFIWLLVGGLAYTFGALIYAVKWPDPWPDVFGFHEIFHIFVMTGSFFHFWFFFKYI